MIGCFALLLMVLILGALYFSDSSSNLLFLRGAEGMPLEWCLGLDDFSLILTPNWKPVNVDMAVTGTGMTRLWL